MLLLSKPEIFGFHLENWVILVAEFLKYMGLNEKESKSFKLYPHVFKRNNIANVRSINLGECFFDVMQNGDFSLLDTYTIVCTDMKTMRTT